MEGLQDLKLENVNYNIQAKIVNKIIFCHLTLDFLWARNGYVERKQ